MKIRNPFSILSKKEKTVHSLVWIVGLILINIPDWSVTMGLFQSQDYSLLFPSIYGTIMNAYLFYLNMGYITSYIKSNPKRFILLSFQLLMAISLLEGTLDLICFYFFFESVSPIILWEAFWGQILMNGIFFYIPSFVFGFWKTFNAKGEIPSLDRIIIKNGSEIIVLSPQELTHIESDGNYCIYHAGRKILVRISLAKVEEQLPDFFIRCHKSFIINSRLIEKQTYNEIVIKEHKIPVGRKYRDKLKSLID